MQIARCFRAGKTFPCLPDVPFVNEDDLHFKINLWKVRCDRHEQKAALESSTLRWHNGERLKLSLLKSNEVRRFYGFSFSLR